MKETLLEKELKRFNNILGYKYYIKEAEGDKPFETADDTTMDDVIDLDNPVEEQQPVEEQPVEEQLVEEQQPVEVEQSVEEQQVEEQQVEEQQEVEEDQTGLEIDFTLA